MSSASPKDMLYMGRCLQLAKHGAGMVAPNPLVGCVIVREDRILGEGYHERFGGPHAEVMALQRIGREKALQDATLYVNLEPCNHQGKTPPCTEAIIQSGIKRVVVGMTDPNSQVNGKGLCRLQEAGIEVVAGVMEEESKQLNQRFIHFHVHQKPYIVLKWAQSSDGYIGKADVPVRISNETTRFVSHSWRVEEQAILVGARTVLTDNPQLNNRLWPGPTPARIVMDRSGSLSGMDHLHVFDGRQRTIVFSSDEGAVYRNAEKIRLPEAGEVIDFMLHSLWKEGFSSILVEGGAKTHELFLDIGAWNECRVFVSGLRLDSGIPAPRMPSGAMQIERMDQDLYLRITKA